MESEKENLTRGASVLFPPEFYKSHSLVIPTRKPHEQRRNLLLLTVGDWRLHPRRVLERAKNLRLLGFCQPPRNPDPDHQDDQSDESLDRVLQL